ncbi:hypothetical protein BH24CHL5_BH24CHL5_06190 [soil metagenome]
MVDFLDFAAAEGSIARHEHREMTVGLDHLHEAVEHCWSDPAGLADTLRQTRMWIATVLEPHAIWEERVLYPTIDRYAGTPWATKAMRYEHRQIERASDTLERDVETLRSPGGHAATCAISSRLAGLEALIRAHIEREDKFLMPLLGEGDGQAAQSS